MAYDQRAVRLRPKDYERIMAALKRSDDVDDQMMAYMLRVRWEQNDGHLPINFAVKRGTHVWGYVAFTGDGTIPGCVKSAGFCFDTEAAAVARAQENTTGRRVPWPEDSNA